jgi:adenylate cyclase
MAVEIERRFLVRNPCEALGASMEEPSHIVQGYFGCIDRLRVRVRILSDERGHCEAFLTFKGARRGYCRLEYEYPLALERAGRALDPLPPNRIIRKKRHTVRRQDSLPWLVDEFEGPNEGLVLAEIELSHAGQEIELPSWIGEEITFNPRYGNSRLAFSPMPSLLDAA